MFLYTSGGGGGGGGGGGFIAATHLYTEYMYTRLYKFYGFNEFSNLNIYPNFLE